MSWIRIGLIVFCGLLGVVIYSADTGIGQAYWGWVERVPLGDKICHCSFMFTFSLLTNLALRCRSMRLGGLAVGLGTLIVAVVVAGEEISQIWIPGRDFDLFDLGADSIGIALGDLLARRINPMLLARGDRSQSRVARV